MKKALLCLISALALGLQMPEAQSQGQGYAGQFQTLETLERSFYNSQNVSIETAFAISQSLEALLEAPPQDTEAYAAALELYLRSAETVAQFYTSGMFESSRPRIDAQASAIERYLPKAKLSADLWLRYADYLYAKIAWAKESSAIIMELPVVYRRALFLSPNHKEAKLKLALWYTAPAQSRTGNWNAFVREQESSIESLAETKRFLAYLNYAQFYMKLYNRRQGYAYLAKARQLFPGHALIGLFEYNFSKAKFVW